MRADARTIIRVAKTRDFAVVHTGVFLDPRLSWKAKGLMGYFLSRPDDWRILVQDLIKRSRDGRDAVYAGLAELRQAGYLEERIYRHPQRGYIVQREYLVYETPKALDPENPEEGVQRLDPDFPDQAQPDQGNPPLLNTDQTKDRGTTTVVVDEDLVQQLRDYLPVTDARALAADYPDQARYVLAHWKGLTEADRRRVKNVAGWIRDAIVKRYRWATDVASLDHRPSVSLVAIVQCPACGWETAVTEPVADFYHCPYCDVEVPFAANHRRL
jgi:predicted RNA-binding Zn-ribbon protein involved in translation (DUF1610 family)